jgi:hypothetical protein
VEYWNDRAKKRIDLFGFGDILVLDKRPGSLIIQVCGDDLGVHKTSLSDNPTVLDWLNANNRIEIWAWRKVWDKNSLGRKAKMWIPRIVDVIYVAPGLLTFNERGRNGIKEYTKVGAWSAEQLIQ